jgi:CHAD domain-containing protein
MEPDYVKLKDIKPALSGYIREATALLKENPVPDENAVHDVRVLMKESRAVMKLISAQIDPESFNRDYASLREVGRILSSWRETSVHRKMLKELKRTNQRLFSNLQDHEKLNLLMQKPEIPAEPTEIMKSDLDNIMEHLDKTGYRIRFQTLDNLDPGSLLIELEKTYSIVIDKYITCRNSQKPANLHELRKKAKDLLYQLWFFRPLNPSSVKSLEKRLFTITQNLGKYNDLTQLITALDYKYTGSSDNPSLDELILIFRKEQDRYLSKVWPQAFRIFHPGQKLVNILGFRILMI